MSIITRETLYDEVWSEPMTTVAERYDVSSNYLARVCEQLSVPRPGRGYWQQLAAGKPVEREPLPEPDPGDETTWKRGSDGGYDVRPISSPVFTGIGERKTRRGQRPKTHPLLVSVREDFLDSKPRTYHQHGYLVPKRGGLPDIFISKDGLARALEFANRLYLDLEDRGHWVREAAVHGHRRPMLEHEDTPAAKKARKRSLRLTHLVIVQADARLHRRRGHGSRHLRDRRGVRVTLEGDEYVKVSMNKATERLKQTERWRFHRRFLPSGRLGLQAYSPYGSRAPWERDWRESKPGELRGLIDEIADELERMAPEIARAAQEADRKAEEDHQRYLVAEEERRRKELEELRAKAAAESRQQLLGIIESWVTACHVEQFFENLNESGEALAGEERAVVERRIERARSLFGGADAIKHFRKWATPEDFFDNARKTQSWRPGTA